MLLMMIALLIIVISIILFIIIERANNFPFFNIKEIITNHFEIFDKCKSEKIAFFICPFLLAIGLTLLTTDFKSIFDEISVATGIMLSMLFTGLSILSTYDFSFVKDQETLNTAKIALTQTINAINFNILLCIFLIITIILINSKIGYSILEPFNIPIIKGCATVIVLYIFIVIILTILLIIKNMIRIIDFTHKIKN